MIETPIVGRYVGEDRKLVFGPPLAYHQFVWAVGGVGGFMFVAPFLSDSLPFYPNWWHLTGLAVFLAAFLASLSFQVITFDLKERTYRRRQGPGMMPRLTQGSFSDLDAVVAITEPRNVLGGGVTYHVVLHWKADRRQPLLVLLQETRNLPPGMPLNASAGAILPVGHRYAQSLGLPFYDNTHFPSPCPVALW